ncbi:MAG: class I SAM-dependent methyltransferase [Gemmatimonadaceae bacterium]
MWAFHARRFRHPVPPEFLTDRVVFSQQPPIRLKRCNSCTHLYRNPRESPDAVRRAYSQTGPDQSVYETLFENQRVAFKAQVRRLLDFSPRARRGLEVGSYVGAFLAASRDAGLSFSGIDVNDTAAVFAAGKGLSVETRSIDEVRSDTPFDAIAIWNTFEQLPDVRAATLAARRLLRDGGVFAVRVPNSGFYIQWRRRLNGPLAPFAERMLVHNNLLGFPYREGFTARSMGRLLADAGFDIQRLHGDTLFPISDRWTKTRGTIDERLTKKLQRVFQRGWRAPWVEVYSIARSGRE